MLETWITFARGRNAGQGHCSTTLFHYVLDDSTESWCMSTYETTTHDFSLGFSFPSYSARAFAQLLG